MLNYHYLKYSVPNICQKRTVQSLKTDLFKVINDKVKTYDFTECRKKEYRYVSKASQYRSE